MNEKLSLESYDPEEVLSQARELNAHVKGRRRRGDLVDLRQLAGDEGAFPPLGELPSVG